MNSLRWLFKAQIPVGGSALTLREDPGNIPGPASGPGGTYGRTDLAART